MMHKSNEAMDFDILVEPENGHFVAQVVGTPYLRAEGKDRQGATAALIESLQQRMEQGDLFRVTVKSKKVEVSKSDSRPVIYDFNPRSLMDLAGVFKDDSELKEICEEAYRLRREQRDREWPE